MNTKNFIIGGVVGGIIHFILGAIFYQVIFPYLYPPKEQETNVLFIALGCLFFAFLISYIFIKWANITKVSTGFIAGAIIGFLYGTSMNFFMFSSMIFNANSFFTDIFINTLLTAAVGATIALVNGKIK